MTTIEDPAAPIQIPVRDEATIARARSFLWIEWYLDGIPSTRVRSDRQSRVDPWTLNQNAELHV